MHWERLAAVRTYVLIIVGIAALAMAAFLCPWWPAGFIVIGLGAFLFEYLTGDGPAEGGDRRVRT